MISAMNREIAKPLWFHHLKYLITLAPIVRDEIGGKVLKEAQARDTTSSCGVMKCSPTIKLWGPYRLCSGDMLPLLYLSRGWFQMHHSELSYTTLYAKKTVNIFRQYPNTKIPKFVFRL